MNTEKKYTFLSKFYDILEAPVERFLFARLRRDALSDLTGEILEAGIGTGKNLQYYRPKVKLTGIDFSSGMLGKARKKCEELKLDNVTLYEMDIQELLFDSNTFDVVVSTFVFCTVPNPVAGLRNLHRVLKPGGRAIFIEHMKSSSMLINMFLYIMNIFSKTFLGTSMIRKTQHNIEKAGFKIQEVENHFFDVVRTIVATK